MLFADDIKMVHPLKSNEVNTAFGEICADLSTLDFWCTSWLVSSPTEKSEIHIGMHCLWIQFRYADLLSHSDQQFVPLVSNDELLIFQST